MLLKTPLVQFLRLNPDRTRWPLESQPHKDHLTSKLKYMRFPSYLLCALLLFHFHLLPFPVHPTGFSFCFFPGFLIIFTLLTTKISWKLHCNFFIRTQYFSVVFNLNIAVLRFFHSLNGQYSTGSRTYVIMSSNNDEINRLRALRSGRFIVLNDSASPKMVIKINFNFLWFFQKV